jgi:antitoxin ParD1/3/4
MNVSLPPELEDFVRSKVKTGQYNSPSDVVLEALRLLEQHEKARLIQTEEFRAEIDRRIAALDRGERIDGEEFFARLRVKSKQRCQQT